MVKQSAKLLFISSSFSRPSFLQFFIDFWSPETSKNLPKRWKGEQNQEIAGFSPEVDLGPLLTDFLILLDLQN